MLSPVAVLLAALYPFAKRVLSLPQSVLGIAFGWGVIMAWAAATTHLSLSSWLLYAATILGGHGLDKKYWRKDRHYDHRKGG